MLGKLKLCCCLVFGFCSAGMGENADTQVPAASLGWEWLYPPQLVDAGQNARMVILEHQNDMSGKSTIGVNGDAIIVKYVRRNDEQYRVVPLTEKLERIPTTAPVNWGPGQEAYIVNDRIYSLGIEKTSMAVFLEMTRKAAQEAKEANLSVLPYPVRGEGYDFQIEDRNGVKLSAKDLRGKVIILDAWTTWCLTCMTKMPALAALSEKYPDDIVVVSVCRNELDKRKEAIDRINSLPTSWHYLLIPLDAIGGKAWSVAFAGGESGSLPRVVVVDKNGKVDSILDTAGISGLSRRVEDLLGKK